MKLSDILRYTIIIMVLSFNIYAIDQAITYQNPMGVILAIGSVLALIGCVLLMKKLQEVETADDDQLFH